MNEIFNTGTMLFGKKKPRGTNENEELPFFFKLTNFPKYFENTIVYFFEKTFFFDQINKKNDMGRLRNDLNKHGKTIEHADL